MKAISIWIDEEDHKEAQKMAVKEDLSLSQLIRKLLREYSPQKNER
jgi:predicted HicB family RNase H-like nuclease